jgi:glyceraldehyde 3-phosphate dehydrogenase
LFFRGETPQRCEASEGVNMSVRVGINGFGRVGRLALRAAFDRPKFAKFAEFAALPIVHINEIKGGAKTAAHLLEFDSVHGRWHTSVGAEDDALIVNGRRIAFSDQGEPGAVRWDSSGVDLVLECSGKFRTAEALRPYFERGVRKVIVAAPIKKDALNVVVGINDHLYDPAIHDIVTAASCTTNCLAPVVKVVHENLGIRHGVITTLHDVTNTQTLVDLPQSGSPPGALGAVSRWSRRRRARQPRSGLSIRSCRASSTGWRYGCRCSMPR